MPVREYFSGAATQLRLPVCAPTMLSTAPFFHFIFRALVAFCAKLDRARQNAPAVRRLLLIIQLLVFCCTAGAIAPKIGEFNNNVGPVTKVSAHLQAMGKRDKWINW